MKQVFYWWADRPGLQLITLGFWSSLALIGMTDPTLITDWFKNTPEPPSVTLENVAETAAAENQAEQQSKPAPVQRPPNVPVFRVGGGDCLLVASLPDGSQEDLISQEGLRTLRKVAAGLSEMPQVEDVLWLDNVPDFNLFGLSGTLLPSANASTRRLDFARQRVLNNPLAIGQLISADGKTILMQITIDWFDVTSDQAVTDELRERAEELAGEESKIRFQITGQVPLDIMMANNHVHDSAKYQLIGYSIMLISALVLFRGFSAVLIVAIAPAVGVFWTTGMLHFFDLQDNPFNDIIVPVLISLVGLTDSVHLMVEIRQQRANGLETPEAARQGVARVGMACLLTSLTTAIGFLSLTWAHHEIVQDFGLCCMVGVFMTFVSVLTVIPLGCRSPLGRRLHVGLGKSLVDGQLRRIDPIVHWVLKHDHLMAITAIVATIVFTLIAFQLTPDEKRFSGLSESGEAAQALRHLDRTLGGLEFSRVYVSWPNDDSNAEALTVLTEVDQMLHGEPLLGNPLGLTDLLDALPGEGTPAERMSLLELLPASLKRAFYQPEYHHASIQFRLQDLGIAAYNNTFERVEQELESIADRHPGFAVELQGSAHWRWKNVYQIVTDLATSLGMASLIIWAVLTIVYRSVRIGLISIIPNLFPLVVTAALLVFGGLHLEMVTVCVFTICVGIAVDDTIHFLTRYQEELQAGGEHVEVIRRAFTGVGSALLMTTIVLVAGLGSAILGDSRDARIFGIMGCLTLGAALFADILLLPALLNRFAKMPEG